MDIQALASAGLASKTESGCEYGCGSVGSPPPLLRKQRRRRAGTLLSATIAHVSAREKRRCLLSVQDGLRPSRVQLMRPPPC